MSSRLLIRGGRVIDSASSVDAIADLLIENGDFVTISRSPVAVEGAKIIDADGMVVCPGFIDLHTHLRFPGFPEKETIESGTEAAASGGFTTVCAMANTNPVVDSPEILEQVQTEIRLRARVRVHQLAALTEGLQGRKITPMKDLAAAGAAAFSDDGKPVWHTEIMREALKAARQLDLPISAHEEDHSIVRNGVVNGEVASECGLSAWPCAGETEMVGRDIQLLKQTGGHLHIAHVSCSETVLLLESARDRGLNVTAEVTPHHLTLADGLVLGDERFGLPAAHPLTKVNPPLRSEGDISAMVDGLRAGVIDAIATDHAPHTAADKDCSYEEAAFGFSGLETALPLLLTLVDGEKLPLAMLIDRLTASPARVFGLEGGTLSPGSPADVCIFDPAATWTLDASALRSKGANTPLIGNQMKGQVVCTLVGGEVVFMSGETRLHLADS